MRRLNKFACDLDTKHLAHVTKRAMHVHLALDHEQDLPVLHLFILYCQIKGATMFFLVVLLTAQVDGCWQSSGRTASESGRQSCGLVFTRLRLNMGQGIWGSCQQVYSVSLELSCGCLLLVLCGCTGLQQRPVF